MDCGAFLEGWCGDAAVSFIVGTADPVDQALIDATDAALARGIEAARIGNKMGDLAYAIGGAARRAGYGLLADHGGHGIGRTMHAEPPVPNDGRPGRGIKLTEGLVIAIEPMLILGGKDDYYHDDDEWTLRSANGRRAAHSEHTVAITADGPGDPDPALGARGARAPGWVHRQADDGASRHRAADHSPLNRPSKPAARKSPNVP